MISILIPVYNCSVTDLVRDLYNQITPDGNCEIIVLDDGSDRACLHQNREIALLPNVRYLELQKNQGRVAIRNLLAQTATYPWILFIDGDSRIIRNDFIAAYGRSLTGHMDVICGGREYAASKPQNCSLALHWEYGRKREKINFQKKTLQPYGGFMSNNFLIRKPLFLTLNFENAVQGYGHEDTWIGMQLEARKAAINYIDNPVEHTGLETAETYIGKSENALRNLLKLEAVAGPNVLRRHVKIFRAYFILKKCGLDRVVNFFYKRTQKLLRLNLKSCTPSLLVFDFYRLGYLTTLKRNTS